MDTLVEPKNKKVLRSNRCCLLAPAPQLGAIGSHDDGDVPKFIHPNYTPED